MQTDTSTELPASQQSPQTNPSQTGVLSPSLTATAPGQLKIIKRNGTVVPYTADKISVAMTKAFLAVEGGTAAASPRTGSPSPSGYRGGTRRACTPRSASANPRW